MVLLFLSSIGRPSTDPSRFQAATAARELDRPPSFPGAWRPPFTAAAGR